MIDTKSGLYSRRGAERRAPRAAQLQVTSFGLSDQGLCRSSNQDRFLVAPLAGAGTVGHLFAVADGIGGSAGGEEASTLTVQSIEGGSIPALRRLCQENALARGRMFDEIRELFRRADTRLTEEMRRRPRLAGMGTTLTVAVHLGRTLFVGHAGDSRCYLMRGGALRRLTVDHTAAHELLRRGLIQPDEMADHPFRHVLSNFVGIGGAKLDVEVHEAELMPGDTVLLCSDGLTEMLSSSLIAEITLSAASPELACRELVARANDMGGHDNVTTIVARAGVAA